MKKSLLLLAFCILFGALKTFANHDIGAGLTYYWIAPNTYLVTYSHYDWISGGSGQVKSFTLGLKAPGCNAGRTVNLQYQATAYAGKVSEGSSRAMNYYVSTFTAIVTFTAAETTCKDWLLSVGSSQGQSAQNLPGTNAVPLYTEATLILGNNFTNSSPIFDSHLSPVLVANRYQPIVHSVGATDPDGDSLVYRMVAPLSGYNQPVTTYASFTSQAMVNPNPQAPYSNPGNPQYAVLPGSASYSPEFPVLSYSANWATGQQNIPATKTFLLDVENGEVAFTPMLYYTGGINAYLASFQVDEYRKLNGIATKIGSVRKETIITVGNAGANINPEVMNLRVNNAPTPSATNFTISPGSTFTLQLDGADANLADSVFLTSNTSIAFPGASFTVSSGFRQSGTFTWAPTAAHIRQQPYFLRVLVKDNAKPFGGTHVETFAIRVRNSGGVTGIAPDINSDINFFVYPNPSQGQVAFKLNNNNSLQEGATIIISNCLGQEVAHIAIGQATNGEFDLKWEEAPNFPAGQYVARLQSNDLLKTIKFVKFK